MNEEQAVLDFFAKQENLPLGLAVANLMDGIREKLNNDFWLALLSAAHSLQYKHAAKWDIRPTEDKNAATQLVGLHANLSAEQALYLRPMVEQQLLGGVWRIYAGLIWSSPPSPAHLKLPQVLRLNEMLEKLGFKHNENFLAWQWTQLHPRQQSFLLRFSQNPQTLLDEAIKPLRTLLIDSGEAIAEANIALNSVSRSTAISLDQLHSKRPS